LSISRLSKKLILLKAVARFEVGQQLLQCAAFPALRAAALVRKILGDCAIGLDLPASNLDRSIAGEYPRLLNLPIGFCRADELKSRC